MKMLFLFVLSICTAGLTYAYSNTAKLFKSPYERPYESNVYADGVVTTPSMVTNAFLLGLLYNPPSISR